MQHFFIETKSALHLFYKKIVKFWVFSNFAYTYSNFLSLIYYPSLLFSFFSFTIKPLSSPCNFLCSFFSFVLSHWNPNCNHFFQVSTIASDSHWFPTMNLVLLNLHLEMNDNILQKLPRASSPTKQYPLQTLFILGIRLTRSMFSLNYSIRGGGKNANSSIWYRLIV